MRTAAAIITAAVRRAQAGGYLHHRPPASHQPIDEDDQCDDQQDVNQSAGDMKREKAQRPQNHQNNRERDQHFAMSPFDGSYRASARLQGNSRTAPSEFIKE